MDNLCFCCVTNFQFGLEIIVKNQDINSTFFLKSSFVKLTLLTLNFKFYILNFKYIIGNFLSKLKYKCKIKSKVTKKPECLEIQV